jgi:hypothetical protein
MTRINSARKKRCKRKKEVVTGDADKIYREIKSRKRQKRCQEKILWKNVREGKEKKVE